MEQPTKWPEYGSYIKIELLEVMMTDNDTDTKQKKEYVVRFFLNGKLLRSNWHGKTRETIPLDVLAHYIQTEGAIKTD